MFFGRVTTCFSWTTIESIPPTSTTRSDNTPTRRPTPPAASFCNTWDDAYGLAFLPDDEYLGSADSLWV